MRLASSLSLALAFAGLVACEDSGRRRPGGGGPNTNTPIVGRDARVAVEGEDAREARPGEDARVSSEGHADAAEVFFPDAFVPQPPQNDAQVIDVGFPTFPDAFVPAPDAFVPNPPPPDAGVARPDASMPQPQNDAGPANVQTSVSEVAGSIVHLGGTSALLTFTLAFDNRGPSAETLDITGATITVLIGTQLFDVAPASHFAPVGHSERSFVGTPSAVGGAPFDPQLVALVCSGLGGVIGLPGLGSLFVDISNGQQVSLVPTLSCTP